MRPMMAFMVINNYINEYCEVPIVIILSWHIQSLG